MARSLFASVMLVVLMVPDSGEAQTSDRAGWAERWKALIFRRDKPETPVRASRSDEKAGQRRQRVSRPKLLAKPKSKRESRLKPVSNREPESHLKRNPDPDGQAIRVTTRSGTLRRPGPEAPEPVAEPRTPTFVEPKEPPRQAVVPQSPDSRSRSVNRNQTAGRSQERPAFSQPSPRARMRDRNLVPAGHEAKRPQKPPKKTFVGWVCGLWSRKETNTPAAEITQPVPRPRRQSRTRAGQSTSIDPRRVYRGPASDRGETEQSTSASGPSSFSETGVPGLNPGVRSRRRIAN